MWIMLSSIGILPIFFVKLHNCGKEIICDKGIVFANGEF